MTSYLIIIHHASLIFTIMQIKPRLLIHIQTIMQIWPDPWPPKVTPDPYEYSLILSIDYLIPIVQKINKKRQNNRIKLLTLVYNNPAVI